MKVFIGWDALDINAFNVCKKTLLESSSIPLEIIPVSEHGCRQDGLYWRAYHVDEKGQKYDVKDGKPFSTGFSFTRFCVPAMAGYEDEWVIFMDPDMLVKGDVAELMEYADEKALYCVQHEHVPEETVKMGGLIQTQYLRKNWSSFMLLKPARNMSLTKYAVNNQSGAWLHALLWLSDYQIGKLPEEWNWLEGHSDPKIIPKVIHYTRGTPDLPNCAGVDRAEEWWGAFNAL